MFTPVVTIAIPIYNGMPYLRDTIQSVLNQTYQDWILYLVNDGSTDGSLTLMKSFAKGDQRIHIINDGENHGLIQRLNQSISICRTKYYARMDADDIMYITRIEEQVKFLESHPEVDVCGSSIMTIDKNNNIIGSGYSKGKVSSFFHPTVMGKTEWFKANPYAKWALRAEDFELWTRSEESSVFCSIEKPLLFYREFGVPTFKKYYLSQITLIRIARRYVNYNKPVSWYFKIIISSYLKIAIGALLYITGKMDVLVSMRRRSSIPEKLKLKEEDLWTSISLS